MKSKCSFILKASTALVLALLMLFGTVTTSVAAVVDNAKNTAEADAAESEAHGAEGFFAALRRNTPDLADTGKKADLAETGYVAHFTLVGDDVGWDAKQALNNVITSGASWYGYAYLTKGKYFALHNGSSQYSNGETFTIGDGGRQSSYSSNAFKYNSNSQVVKICYDESNNREWYPWVWLEAANIYLSGDSGLASASWDTSGKSADKMTLSSGKYTITKTVTTAGTYQYKVNAGDGWIYNPLSSNQSVTTTHNGDKVTITFNPSNKTANATVTHPSYTVTLNVNSGTINAGNVTSYTCGTGATLPTDVTRTGYNFGGWYDNSSLTGTAVTSISTTATGNKTYWAKWTPKSYTITYKDQGNVAFSGTHASGYPTSHTYGTATTLKSASKTGYNFLGWFTTSACTGTAVTSLGATAYTSNITLYAKWEDAGTCGLTLSKSSTALNIGATETVTVIPNAYHTSGTISAKSNNTSVATVTYNTSTKKFTVTAKSHGTATITVSCTEGGSATFSVTVNTPTISVALGSSSLNIGGTTTITPTVTNQGTATVTYSSSNTSVATISGTTITAVAPGTTNITATVDGVTSTAKTLTVNAPTISVSKNTTIKVGATYTPSPTLTNPSSTGGKWTVGYVLKSGTTATTNGTTITAVNYGSATTFTAQYKYDGTVVATKDFTVTPVTPSVTAFSYSAINVGGTANPSVTKSNVDNMTVSYAVQSGSAVTVNSTTGQITGVVPTASNATTVRVTYTYGTCSVYRDATVTVNTPSITQGDVTIAKGDSKTLSTATTNPSSGLTVTFALSGSPNGVTCTSAGKVTVAQNSTASSATVVATAKNSGDTTVATKNITVTIAAPSLTVQDGSTSVINGTVYTTKGTNKTLTVGTNFSGTLTAKSSNTNIATVSLSGTTLTIEPKAKGTCKVSVSTDSDFAPTGASADLAATAAAMPQGLLRKVLEIAATGAVATQTAQFTVNVAEADSNKFITYATSSWTGTVYAWYGNAWHTMIKVGTDDSSRTVWALNVGSSYPSTVVFSSQNSWNDGGNGLNQTVDCSVSASANSFYENGQSDGKRNVGSYATTITIPQLIASDVSVKIDQTGTISTTVVNNTTPAKTTYTSNSTSIATVTTAGVVTGKSVGNTTVTVRAWAAKPHSSWTQWITDSTTQALLSGTATSNIAVTADPQTITNSGAYYKTGSAAYASGDTGGTFTVSQTGSLAYNTNITLTATAASGYAVEGIYWSTNGTTWTRVTTTDTTANGYVTKSVYNSFKVTDNFRLKAQFVQVLKLSAFDSYEMKNSQVTFVTAPPKSITIKHTDAHGTATTYTYSYDGTKTAGNPESPDGSKPAALAIATGKYGQGNYIQYYAGDEITLTYSAMASSEILKGVFYDNSKNFYVAKPTSGQFIAHRHPTTPAIYMNGAYYTSAQLGSRDFTGVTADNDAHSIKFTGTQDYKNIDVEIGAKRKVYFSDYTNAIIGSKNTDDYYADDEALSETTGTNPKQLTVKAAKSATQTNTITASNIRFYKANADGTKGEAVDKNALGITITGESSTSSSSSDGAALVFNGNMPAYDLYIDLNMQNSYTLKLGTKVVSSLGEANVNYLKQKANTISIAGSTTLSANTNGYVTSGTTSVNTGTTATLSVTGLASGYMFVGWYWGDASGPDYDKGFISDKATLSYAPKKGGIIWAVGTKDLFINGSKYITGKDTDWNVVNNVAQNLQMSFDAKSGRYYWEITDTMYNTVSSTGFNYNSSYAPTTKSGDYYYFNTETDFGNSFFQFFDTATGDTRTIWSLPGTEGVTFYTQNSNGVDFGKARQTHDTENGHHNKYEPVNALGWIKFKESDSPGYSSPLRIYYDPDSPGYFTVEATAIYSDIYVSNGYSVGSTLKTDAVTVQPVVDGVVKTSGAGSFSVGAGTTYSPDHEGTVTKYTPAKKGATVRITKEARGSDKIAAFLIYDIENKTVRAEKNITKGTTASGKTPYYIDLTLANEKQVLYIVPIVEEADAKVTITFDATQLNRAQWGDIVTAYSWYQGSNNDGLGEYPGQPMIPSDDMSTWTTSFPTTKGGKELAGITFTNYVDGIHSWLGCSGVMGEVSDHKTGTATGGIINVYNHVDSGDNGEYSRTNYKAQTYDYHEPIALYNRFKNEETINISFQMKDGNSTLISWYHKDLVNTSNNILNPSQEKWRLNFEYLTNAKGDQYIDMNGNPLGANNKPTATFYVASKGLAVYQNSTMKYIFDSGQNYEMQGYEAKYTRGTGDRGYYTRQNGGWSSAITYGGVTGLDMKYAVQWYVYDAQGNYITTVLSAGIADLSSNNTDTYIAKQLEDLGYAVDGKSVAICYDKPRYMYGDWDKVTNSADDINSGPNFDAYRFEGQWIAAAKTDTVKVNVGVGMMTDSGEVLADSNTAAYGNATASLRSGITFGKPNYATVANDGSWAQTAATDAKLNGIVLNASEQNFIGWYYYDANTGDFVKANYASNEDFYPNYSNKDVTFYAMYKASAVYNYIYRGRESSDDISTWKVYSAAGNALTSEEMANQNKVLYNNHSDDVIAKLPVGIGVFKKNIDFSAANSGSWTKDNNTQYILKLSGFNVTSPTYTLTAHYKNANGKLVTIEDSEVYNGKAVNLTTGTYVDSEKANKPAGTPVTSYKPGFIGWYEFNPNNETIGELLSTQANYGMRLTKHQHIIAVYEGDGRTLPTDGWKAYIDENEVNKELTTEDTGVFYNDTIVRVRNGSDVKATLDSDAKIGVIVVCDNKTNKTINGYSDTDLNTLVTRVDSGKTMKTASGLSITNMQATTQTSFNRTDIAVRADYAKTLGAKYCVYAYIYDGSNYHFSAASDVKTYE